MPSYEKFSQASGEKCVLTTWVYLSDVYLLTYAVQRHCFYKRKTEWVVIPFNTLSPQLAKRQKGEKSGEETKQTEIGRKVEIQLQQVTGLKPIRLLSTFLSHSTQGQADSLAGK